MFKLCVSLLAVLLVSCVHEGSRDKTYSQLLKPTETPITVEFSKTVLLENINGVSLTGRDRYKYKALRLNDGKHILKVRYLRMCSSGLAKEASTQATVFFEAKKGHTYRIFASECLSEELADFTLFDSTAFEKTGEWFKF